MRRLDGECSQSDEALVLLENVPVALTKSGRDTFERLPVDVSTPPVLFEAENGGVKLLVLVATNVGLVVGVTVMLVRVLALSGKLRLMLDNSLMLLLEAWETDWTEI